MRNWLRHRKYKSGTAWGLWLWTETPSDYILRLHVLKTPFFAICLHWINGPDPEPHMHDHPVTFLSIILRGRYTEQRYCAQCTDTRFGPVISHIHCRDWFNFIRASRDDRHRITAIALGTLTLCFMGPKVRTWGFHTSGGWVPWREYNMGKYG